MTKKVFTKADLLVKAQDELGDKMPETLLGTGDGHLFLIGARSLASDHARRNGVQLYTLKRADLKAAQKPDTPQPTEPQPTEPQPTEPQPEPTEARPDAPKPKSNSKK